MAEEVEKTFGIGYVDWGEIEHDTFVRVCEGCDETDADGNAFCEGCNCTDSDCDCDVCEIRRANSG